MEPPGAWRVEPLVYRRKHRPREENLPRVTQLVWGRHRPGSQDSLFPICLIFFLLHPMTSLITMGGERHCRRPGIW